MSCNSHLMVVRHLGYLRLSCLQRGWGSEALHMRIAFDGVGRDTYSPLLLYMLWKCEHESVVVVCLAWGLACPSILSLHEHGCCSFIEHGSMPTSATFRNEHRHVGCVFIICPRWAIYCGGVALVKFLTHLLPHSRFPEDFEAIDSHLTLMCVCVCVGIHHCVYCIYIYHLFCMAEI